jgi:hypothetical protein
MHASYATHPIGPDSPDTALTRPYDLVGRSAGIDSSTFRFESSTSTGWVDGPERSSGTFVRRCGWPRYVARLAPVQLASTSISPATVFVSSGFDWRHAPLDAPSIPPRLPGLRFE